MTSPSTTLPAALDDLAWAIARDGIEQHEAAVARAVLALRSAGAVTRSSSTWWPTGTSRPSPASGPSAASASRSTTSGRRDPRRLAA